MAKGFLKNLGNVWIISNEPKFYPESWMRNIALIITQNNNNVHEILTLHKQGGSIGSTLQRLVVQIQTMEDYYPD